MPSLPRRFAPLLALCLLLPNLARAADPGETVTEISPRIWVIFQAKNGDYWFGSDDQGAYRFNGKTTVQLTTKHGLAGDRVREFHQDKSGNIFIGTLTGFSKFDGKAFTTLAPVESQDWRLDPADLWFKGDSMVDGPYRYDGKTLHHLKFPKSDLEDDYLKNNPNQPWSPYGVYTIYHDSRDHLWFGTAAFGLCRYDGKSFGWLYERDLSETPSGGSFGIRSIAEDKHGKFWINNARQRFTIAPEPGKVRYTKEAGVPQPKVTGGEDPAWYNGIAKDTNQHLWMSTFGKGVWHYDGQNLTNYPAKDGDKDALGVSIYLDNQAQPWLGTLDSGPYRLQGKNFEKFRP